MRGYRALQDEIALIQTLCVSVPPAPCQFGIPEPAVWDTRQGPVLGRLGPGAPGRLRRARADQDLRGDLGDDVAMLVPQRL